jgi:hypothetical protein
MNFHAIRPAAPGVAGRVPEGLKLPAVPDPDAVRHRRRGAGWTLRCRLGDSGNIAKAHAKRLRFRSNGGFMLQAFVFERVGVLVGDLYFLDPNPHPGQEGPEHGVRIELRVFDRGELKGTIYSAMPIEIGRPIWRVDLLESVDGKPGSFNRTHHHPTFKGWNPSSRVFLKELSADPLAWLGGELADLPAVLERAGVPQFVADPSDAESLRNFAPAIVSVTEMMLEKVRAGELGVAPTGDDADSIRVGWL